MKAERPRKLPRSPFMGRIMLWLTTARRSADGLWLGAYSDGNAEAVLVRVEAALSLIKTQERPRYDRLCRDLDRIWVRDLDSSAAHFDPALRACVLDERFVLDGDTDATILAATIVHEATHARLWHYGFGYEEACRHRVETICLRRELAFARRLPDGQPARERAEAALALPPSYFTDAAFRERALEGVIQTLQELKPRWLARLFLAMIEAGRRRAERRRQAQE
jgi:hypothetical protein